MTAVATRAPLAPGGEPASEESGQSPQAKWTVLLASASVFLIALEMTIISVALPRIEDAFADSTRATLSWVFTAYNVGVASLLLIGGWIAERHGRKRVFLTGLSIFAIGSLVTGLAPSVTLLIAGRVVQAVGAALLLPSSLALVLHGVPANRRDAAIGVWGAMAGLAAAIGPTAGAVLVQYAGWRWVFLVNVPIAIGAVIKGRQMLHETRDPNAPTKVDLVAVPIGAIGTALLVFAIAAAGPLGLTNPRVYLPLLGAAAAIAVFARRSVRHEHPVFPIELVRQPSYRIGVAGTGLFGAAFAGWLVLAPTFLVEVWGYSVMCAGFAIAPAPLAMAIIARPAGNLAARLGHRTVISVGSLIPVAGVAFWVAQVTSTPQYLTAFLPGAILVGIGIGIGFPMLTAASMRDVAPGRYAMGAAGNTTLRQVAMALGISAAVAIVGTNAADLTRFHLSWLVCGALFALTSVLTFVAYPPVSIALQEKVQ